MRNNELHAVFDKVANTMDALGTRLDALAATVETIAANADADRKADNKRVEEEMRILRIELGGVGRSMGYATEEFFYNSLMAEPMLKGMRFDDVLRNQQLDRNGVRGEFDLILLNSHHVFLNEVKHKAKREHLDHLIEEQASRFRKYHSGRKVTPGHA